MIDPSRKVIGAAIEVHRRLGPGLLESAYQRCLAREFDLRGVGYQQQLSLPVTYKGVALDCAYRIDFLVDNLVLEIKSMAGIEPVHEAQVLTYMKLGRWPLGLLINFNVPMLVSGIRRIIL